MKALGREDAFTGRYGTGHVHDPANTAWYHQMCSSSPLAALRLGWHVCQQGGQWW